ncbi:MarR family winged helix-turn-helix transcriptional regulator [Priestia aryabhattai]|uniref:MarR family winged helix-turn-helix transcriptional regulator n=1 Tax=Priestia aryabhattai TaxID=412384 RepID=UPI002E1C5978|nr:MarR family transcriptional regulator [Priestia aryabhattai]MED3992364.1 MarR family transcriptional regulator [Priestia aryabhattai]
MKYKASQKIEYETALLVRLITSLGPRFRNLEWSEYLLLNELQGKDPLSINELSYNLRLTISTTSRQVSMLETKELVQRFPYPKNGKISLITTTPKGKALLQEVQTARKEAYADILYEWSKEELKVLAKQLTRLNDDLRNCKKE